MRICTIGKSARLISWKSKVGAWPPSYRALTQLSKHGFSPSVDHFRAHAVIPNRPFLFHNRDSSLPESTRPTIAGWISKRHDGSRNELGSTALSSHVTQFDDWPFPYELLAEDPACLTQFRDWLLAFNQDPSDFVLAGILEATILEADTDHGSARTFFQLHAPLRLLNRALHYNSSAPVKPILLYIAQSSLDDLPPALQSDLPTPELVRLSGKGDVYSSSIWLGTEPTFTPLHRDPNPNLFHQLFSSKIIRLLPPNEGDRLFFEVQTRLRQQDSSIRGENSRIRTTEMMEGAERKALHDVIWDDSKQETLHSELLEACLDADDALYIPQGWWHSVKSCATQGGLNVSANWWFR